MTTGAQSCPVPNITASFEPFDSVIRLMYFFMLRCGTDDEEIWQTATLPPLHY